MPAKPIRPDRVAIYIRWSTDDQAHGTTLEIQREGCEHFVRSQGWIVRNDLVFIDEGYSGGSLDRPAITRLREAASRGEIDCVVVLKIDRLSRNIVDAVDLVLREWENRCYIKSVREPIDSTSDLGRVIFGILAMFADFERVQIRDRTQGGKTRRIAEGKQLHAEAAFGYTRHPSEKGVWVEHPNEAPVVRRIFEMAATGISANRICRTLNQEGGRTRAGREWSIRGVLWILHNRLYIGEVVYGRTSLRPAPEGTPAPTSSGVFSRKPRKRLVRVLHDHPQVAGKTQAAPCLVDPDTFARAQERLQANQSQRQTTGSRGAASPHLLVGIAKCPCGSALVHKVQSGRRNRERGKEYRHYICQRSRQGMCDCNGHIPAEPAEQMVGTVFLNLFGLKDQREEYFQPFVAEAFAEVTGIEATLRQAEAEIAQLDHRDDEIRAEVLAGRIPMESVQWLRTGVIKERVRLEDRRQGLLSRRDELCVQANGIRGALLALDDVERWNLLEAQQKRHLLHVVLAERITICKPKGKSEIALDVRWAVVPPS